MGCVTLGLETVGCPGRPCLASLEWTQAPPGKDTGLEGPYILSSEPGEGPSQGTPSTPEDLALWPAGL